MRHRPPVKLSAAFEHRFGRAPRVVARAPGRVDLLGAHVDYNDGHILAMAIDRHVWVACDLADRPATTTVLALDLGQEARFEHSQLEAGMDVDGVALPSWARYPAGVAWALAEQRPDGGGAGQRLPGLDAVVTGDVPLGAGVSSSAALEVAFAAAWLAVSGRRLQPLDLAKACRRAENEYVGVACGLMDQFCAVLGRPGQALLLDCRTLAWHGLPLPPRSTLVLADTLSRRQLSDGALNVRQGECRQALDALSTRLPGIAALRDVTAPQLEAFATVVPEPALSRARHIVAEERRVLAAADALSAGDELRLGALMDQSYESARDLYAASGPQLEAMWTAGHQEKACLGGRFIGAGFAGCVLFLVERDSSRSFAVAVGRRFTEATGSPARLAAVRAAAGASAALLTPVP